MTRDSARGAERSADYRRGLLPASIRRAALLRRYLAPGLGPGVRWLAMPLDEDPGNPVAWRSAVSATLRGIAAAGILAMAGCGPTVQPETTEPSNVTPPPRPPT